ncbi:MAG: hypothetical protein V1742_02465 [Pseudomonadota bacterium]
MTVHINIAAWLLILFAASGLTAEGGPDYSGRWEAKVFLAKVYADMEQRGDQIKGVAYVHQPWGKVDVYHFQGWVRNGQVTASHFTGHVFKGVVTPEGTVAGVLTTAKGYNLKVEASRSSGPVK